VFSVGQKLWFVPNDRRYSSRSREVTIEKIGRKWITLANNAGRVDMQTLVSDVDGYSPGRCYISKEAWEESEGRRELWLSFRRAVDRTYNIPDSITIDDIKQAAAALKFSLNSPPGL
jgi:hypothetical protein